MGEFHDIRIGPNGGGSGGAPSGPAGGDLDGTYPNPTLDEQVFIDYGLQPEHPASASNVTVYADSVLGSDSGLGSALSPYQTYRRALKHVSQNPIGTNTIQLVQGSFDLGGFHSSNGLTVQADLLTGTALVVVSATEGADKKIDLVVTGPSVLAGDLAGQYVKITSGAANGLRGTIETNEATGSVTPGETIISCVWENTTAAPVLPTAADTGNLESVSVLVTGQPSIRAGTLTISGVAWTGGSGVLIGIAQGAACTLRRCNFSAIGSINQEGGTLNLVQNYVAPLGGSLRGVLRNRGGVTNFSGGNVIAGDNAGSNNFLTFTRGAVIDFNGVTCFKDIEAIYIDGSRLAVTQNIGSWNAINFGVDAVDGFKVDHNTKSSGTASSLMLPICTGAISGNFFVDARGVGGSVFIDPATSVTTALGTNTVSTDGSTSVNFNQSDVLISGGTPNGIASKSGFTLAPGAGVNSGFQYETLAALVAAAELSQPTGIVDVWVDATANANTYTATTDNGLTGLQRFRITGANGHALIRPTFVIPTGVTIEAPGELIGVTLSGTGGKFDIPVGGRMLCDVCSFSVTTGNQAVIQLPSGIGALFLKGCDVGDAAAADDCVLVASGATLVGEWIGGNVRQNAISNSAGAGTFQVRMTAVEYSHTQSGITAVTNMSNARCFAYNLGTQSCSDSILTALTMDSELYDTSGFHSTSVNTSRFTIPAGLSGVFAITGTLFIATGSVATGFIQATLRLNGTLYIASQLVPASTLTAQARLAVSRDYPLVSGDYIELVAWQSTGASRNASGWTAAANMGTSLSITKVA